MRLRPRLQRLQKFPTLRSIRRKACHRGFCRQGPPLFPAQTGFAAYSGSAARYNRIQLPCIMSAMSTAE